MVAKHIRVVDRTVPGGDALDADFDYRFIKETPAGPRGPNGGVAFSKEIALELLEHIARGKSLRSFCEGPDRKTLPGRPSVMSVIRWRAQIPKFAELYKSATEDRADSLVDEMLDVAHSEPDPKRARVIIDTMKWAAAKFKPRVYGDRVAITGAADGAPIQVERVISEISDDDLLAIAQGKSRG